MKPSLTKIIPLKPPLSPNYDEDESLRQFQADLFTPWCNSNAHFQDCFDTDAKNASETVLRQIATTLCRP